MRDGPLERRANGGYPPLVVGIEDVNGRGLGAGDRLRKPCQRGENGVADAVEQPEFSDHLQTLRLGVGDPGLPARAGQLWRSRGMWKSVLIMWSAVGPSGLSTWAWNWVWTGLLIQIRLMIPPSAASAAPTSMAT